MLSARRASAFSRLKDLILFNAQVYVHVLFYVLGCFMHEERVRHCISMTEMYIVIDLDL